MTDLPTGAALRDRYGAGWRLVCQALPIGHSENPAYCQSGRVDRLQILLLAGRFLE